jgi:hypothetical protein
MLTTRRAAEMARSLPDVTERDHFGSDAFRTQGGIFATVWHETNTVNLKLTPEQQRRFVLIDGEGFVEIDNAWGRQGWTKANLEFLEPEQFGEALRVAWTNSHDKPPRVRKSKAKPVRAASSKRRARGKVSKGR